MFEIEVTEPLPRLSLNDDQTGLAIVMRRKGRPVGFWLDSPAGKRTLQPAEIGQRILAEAGQTLLAEAIREEMAPPLTATLPSVTIAICTKDRPNDLAGLLKSLQASLAATARRNAVRETMVIDNASSDDRTRQTALSFSGTRYLLES
jgi:hypothetical protein